MTRINSAIPVKCLTDEHLLAEHREIKRLPYCLRKAIVSGSIDKIHGKFTLGKCHALFFLDKMSFILGRYSDIYYELIDRISDRIINRKKKFWHYYGKTISKEDAIGLLK